MSMSLYQLTDNYLQLQQMIEDSETPSEALIYTLEAIQDELPIKVENIAKVIRGQKLTLEAIDKEIERLIHLKKPLENKVNYLGSYLQTNMEVLKLPEVKTPTMSIKLVKNPASVEITDITKVPKKYIKRTFTEAPDKVAIKEAINNKEEVPGAMLMQRNRLQIK